MSDVDLGPYVPLSEEPPAADTPLWLSHHHPEAYERCAVVAGRHVCRRCLVLYPLALVAGVAISLGSWWDHALDPWVLWLFPLPGVIEFVLDNLGRISYSARRQVLLSAAGALAAGVGLRALPRRPHRPARVDRGGRVHRRLPGRRARRRPARRVRRRPSPP